MARLVRHLSYANVMASIAVFVALGGSGYAAVTLSKNSVGSAQIKNGSVKAADLARNSVSSSTVKDGSLRSVDFAPGQLPAGSPGIQGPKGDAGTPGLTGAPGAPGISGYERVTGPLTSNPAGAQTLGSADCPAGKSVLGGGVEGTGDTWQSVNASFPQSASTWKALVNNTSSGTAASFYVYAICAVVG